MTGRSTWWRWIAALCGALTVVFAGASAASALNRLQHGAQLQHEHGLHQQIRGDDGHHDHAAAAHDHEDDGGEREGDHPTGLGHHHHADAPSGALSDSVEAYPLLVAADARLSAGTTAAAEGIRPGGLERPPRTRDTLD